LGPTIAVFTGPENITIPEREYIRGIVTTLPLTYELFVSGAAVGVDTICALQAIDTFQNARHLLVVPNYRHNHLLVQAVLRMTPPPVVDVEYMPGMTDAMDRNDRMIFLGEALYAFPASAQEEQRSGTWATIRRARKKQIPIYYFPLNGKAPWVENAV
jgi:predicted Rossmann fold nucleotide-binding protein DprA/Smf involved in DNA uptake